MHPILSKPHSYVYRIKEGKLDTWREWSKEVMARSMEAVATIREEQIAYEVFIEVEIGGVYFVHGITIPFYGSEPGPIKKDRPINAEHLQKMHECLEPLGVGVMLYWLEDTGSLGSPSMN
jgi:hypothetical protein